MGETTRVPEVRFEGFTDPWEQRKLGEIADVYDGVHQTPNYTTNGIMFLSVENISTLQSEKYISPEDYERDFKVKPEKGDLFMTRIGDIGTPNILKTSDNVAFYVSLALLKPRIVNSWFLIFSIQSSSVQRELNRRTLLSAIPQKINKDEIGKVRIAYPSSAEEQQNIGSFFSSLDDLITLHQRKLELLQNTKKAMLDKMFPKPGEVYPEVRFEGFTDPWEQRKFSEFVYQAGTKNKNNLPLESYSVSNDRGFVPQDEQFENGGSMKSADKSAYWIVEPGSFAYNPARINVGSIGYHSTSENIIVSSLYEVFKADETCDDHFLWHWLKSPLFMRQIEMFQEGGVRLYFFFDKLLKSMICMPHVDEQRTIGAYFDRLDNLITLHQRKRL